MKFDTELQLTSSIAQKFVFVLSGMAYVLSNALEEIATGTAVPFEYLAFHATPRLVFP